MQQNESIALRPRDAARALGVSLRTLWGWTRDGRLPHIKLGRVVLYPVAMLREWIEQQAGEGRP